MPIAIPTVQCYSTIIATRHFKNTTINSSDTPMVLLLYRDCVIVDGGGENDYDHDDYKYDGNLTLTDCLNPAVTTRQTPYASKYIEKKKY